MIRHTARCATNKAKLEYRDCTRFSQGVQPHVRSTIKDQVPWTIGRIERTVAPSSAITYDYTGAGGRETGRAPACDHEERDTRQSASRPLVSRTANIRSDVRAPPAARRLSPRKGS